MSVKSWRPVFVTDDWKWGGCLMFACSDLPARHVLSRRRPSAGVYYLMDNGQYLRTDVLASAAVGLYLSSGSPRTSR